VTRLSLTSASPPPPSHQRSATSGCERLLARSILLATFATIAPSVTASSPSLRAATRDLGHGRRGVASPVRASTVTRIINVPLNEHFLCSILSEGAGGRKVRFRKPLRGLGFCDSRENVRRQIPDGTRGIGTTQ